MFKSNLIALEHPSPTSLDFNNRKDFASTVIWLEDQKIRHLPIEDRGALRKIDNLQKWEIKYNEYKINLGMPAFVKPVQEMAWLLSYAVRLEYLDNAETYKDINSTTIDKNVKAFVPNMKSQNSFDNLDTTHPDFQGGVTSLINQLGFVHHPNPEVLLEAAAIFINRTKESCAGKQNNVSGTPMPLEENSNVTKDRSLDQAVRILRFNQIYKLRDLQTKINESLVLVQNVTADPKTDTKLGKVGF